jgi:hypothetical protein
MISQFKGNWETHPPTVVCDLNTTVHLATGFTAHFLPYGWQPTDIGVPLVFKILRIILISIFFCHNVLMHSIQLEHLWKSPTLFDSSLLCII